MSGIDLAIVGLSYLIGSIPFGLLAGRLKGIDIRQHGSGNIGATNVTRLLGKGVGSAVFALDFLKGLAPVLIARALTDDGLIPIAAAVAAILGHNYPVWLGFRGGKGIATSGGALAGLLPWALAVALIAFALTFALSRYVSLASLAAAASLPLTTALLTFRHGGLHPAYLIFACLVAALAFWRHRANIRRLLDGTEHRFTRRSGS